MSQSNRRSTAPLRVRKARAALEAAVSTLGDDELRVLTSIAQRLKFGARVYGRLDLASDRRAFRQKEAREEIEDFLVYLACAWLRQLEAPQPRRFARSAANAVRAASARRRPASPR